MTVLNKKLKVILQNQFIEKKTDHNYDMELRGAFKKKFIYFFKRNRQQFASFFETHNTLSSIQQKCPKIVFSCLISKI